MLDLMWLDHFLPGKTYYALVFLSTLHIADDDGSSNDSLGSPSNATVSSPSCELKYCKTGLFVHVYSPFYKLSNPQFLWMNA